MFHLDNTSGVPDMPEPKEPMSNTPRWFGESVQQGGISWPGADWFNIVQAEMLSILGMANINPEKTSFNQVASAIQKVTDDSISLPQGGRLQSAILYITPQMFGARGDYNPLTDTGHNDTPAFKMAIYVARQLGGRCVTVPGGFKYLIDDELNLGGENYYGSDGVALVGEGIDNTAIYFRPKNPGDTCIAIRGGSGTNTPRGLFNLTLRPVEGALRQGVGLDLEGCCFANVNNVNIRFFDVNVRLHNKNKGAFTEFNRFSNMRIDRANTNILYVTTHGDNSFHGNSWNNIQNQILDGGYGLRVVSNNGSRAHLYNNSFGINFFGSTSGSKAYAVSMTMCNCDYSWTNMTFEGDVYLQSTDDSWWHCWGIFSGYNGVLRYDCPVPPRLGVPASFIFDNGSSVASLGNFTESELSLCYPQTLDMNWANRALIGSYPGIIRTRSTSGFVNSLAFVNAEGDTSGFRFGSVSDGGRLQDLKTKWVLNTLGTVLSASNPSGTLYLNANNTSTGALSRVFFSQSTFSPGSDNTMSSGNPGQRWNQVYAANSAIGLSDATHKTDPRNPIDVEYAAFYEIGSELPWVWMWLAKYAIEGDEARLHSGPTVQAAIEIMGKHGLNWTDYACFCYDSWQEQEEIVRTWDAQPAVYETVPARPAVIENGIVIEPAIPERQVLVTEAIEAGGEVVQEYRPAGGEYSFRKDELLLWITRATIAKQNEIEERLARLEAHA
ncbi:tail fiber domain-containing protein [Serratia marcescens]|uniref:tail fiber domain-containing protein n=1 Tax=Serratia marcescens TaxID=615 RepID=UPI0027631545|nr:tail fiber domain-containing protein [Serratia marcescens]MDP8834501.1 tail fiber domain-containing protein [Serratia marcescens]